MERTTEREKATGRGVGTEHFAKFMGRLARSYSRAALAGELDTTALAQLAQVRATVDEQIAATVAALRSEAGGSYSWEAVGAALGITRHAACRKYGDGTGARRPGGQPAALR